jgi:hypothetical protein
VHEKNGTTAPLNLKAVENTAAYPGISSYQIVLIFSLVKQEDVPNALNILLEYQQSPKYFLPKLSTHKLRGTTEDSLFPGRTRGNANCFESPKGIQRSQDILKLSQHSHIIYLESGLFQPDVYF